MDKEKDDFLEELLNDFKIEAAEHLQTIMSGLLDLEKDLQNPGAQTIIETVFRATHSMKGAARAVNLMQIERLCMSLESVFHDFKNNKLYPAAEMFELFFQVADTLSLMVKELDTAHKTISENHINQLSNKLKSLPDNTSGPTGIISTEPAKKKAKNEPAVQKKEQTDQPKAREIAVEKPEPAQDEKKTAEKETIRVSTAKLYDNLHMAEELIAFKSGLRYHSEQLQQLSAQLNRWRRKHEERVALADKSMEPDHWEMLVQESEQLKNHESSFVHVNQSLEQLQRTAGRTIDDLIVSIKKTMMQPFSSLFMVVPRIVRDLSKEYNKPVDLDMQGAEIEIDRRILEALKDPLIHLIRNCIDHGLESPEHRRKHNKPETGQLQLKVYNDTDRKVKIEVRDDGAGINREKLISVATRAGIIKAEEVESMSDVETNKLIFASGISTSPFITDVSGRGLGMAIVAEKIAGIGGTIDIESKRLAGTTFIITLPRTLATFRGILVKASDDLFLIPTTSIVKAVKITAENVKTIESKNTIRIQNESIGLVSLSKVLGLPKKHGGDKAAALQGLLLEHAQKKLIFIVEEVLGEHEGLVKDLGPQLKHINHIAGASLLGSGKIVPVLQIAELINTATGRAYGDDLEETLSAKKQTIEEPAKVLVAEDSITVRNMLRNYLESAGFAVQTAVDGLEAYERLQSDEFDVVVSDVEMPRMNGFELTAKIKTRLDLNHLPVILVTALESADDRRRGMDAGANAYIVKSDFEKSNLIDTIERLI